MELSVTIDNDIHEIAGCTSDQFRTLIDKFGHAYATVGSSSSAPSYKHLRRLDCRLAHSRLRSLRVFQKYDRRPPKKTLVILGTAMVLTWLETATEKHVPIAGLLRVMAIGFIILGKSEAIAHLLSEKLKKLWIVAELLLFILVGAQVNIHVAWDAALRAWE